jgi:hypothetical protein
VLGLGKRAASHVVPSYIGVLLAEDANREEIRDGSVSLDGVRLGRDLGKETVDAWAPSLSEREGGAGLSVGGKGENTHVGFSLLLAKWAVR